MSRSSETRTENVARELLSVRGWKTTRPPKGNVLWKNEYRDYPDLLAAMKGKGKQGRGGDGYPDFLVVDPATMQPLIVGETKSSDGMLKAAIQEARGYGDAFLGFGQHVLAAGIAGSDNGDIAIQIDKHSPSGWKSIEYRKSPIQWIPTEQETSHLLHDADLFDLQPKVPSSEILHEKGDEINRILRESKISDPQRPQITGAIMLALWQSRGAIRTSPEHVLGDINTACKKAFVKAGKQELSDSLQVPEANGHLASRAWKICHILRLLNITNLTTEHDYLGQLYETFFRFTGGNTIGQYFTPRHVTQMAARLCSVSRSDIVVDPTCGTGGFLIAALNRMTSGQHLTGDQLGSFVKDHLMGFESEPITAALCVANMILRGDGKTGIIPEDCFTSSHFPDGKATIVLGNPPFPHKKTDTPPEKFVNRGLEALGQRGQLAMIVPGSLLVTKPKGKWRANILKSNSLKAVITLPSELFQPYAAATTALLLIEKGVKQNAQSQTFFARITNDGYRLHKNTRVEQEGSQLEDTVVAYRSGTSSSGFCITKPLDMANASDEWSPGAHIATKQHSTSDLKNQCSFLLRNLAAFHALYAPELSELEVAIETGVLESATYSRKHKQQLERPKGSIGDLFDVYYGQSELENKQGLRSGLMPIISSAGTDNGCYGFFDFDGIVQMIKPPFVTVPRTGSIGESFVQLWPCGVTSDCLVLMPKAGTDIEDLFLAASALRLERWRFDYGRKMTPGKISAIPINRTERLKTWVRLNRVAVDPVMRRTMAVLSKSGLAHIRSEFRRLAKEWKEATGHLSSVERKAIHPAYQRIMAMGEVAIPLILEELQSEGGHWFWALQHLTEENPADGVLEIEAARNRWVSWGEDRGYI